MALRERKGVFKLNFLRVNLLGLFSGLCSQNQMPSSALGVAQLRLPCLKGSVDSFHLSPISRFCLISGDSHSAFKASSCFTTCVQSRETSEDLSSAQPLLTHPPSCIAVTA